MKTIFTALFLMIATPALATDGWFRIDTDDLGTQFWVGATHEIAGVNIASDLYLVGTTGEIDVGPAFTFDNLTLTPMFGVVFDFNPATTQNDKVPLWTHLVPQLFVVFDDAAVYFEAWLQYFMSEAGDYEVGNLLHHRSFFLLNVFDGFAFGPQYDVDVLDGTRTSSIVGLRANVEYGKHNTVGVFVGRQSIGNSNDVLINALDGRLTFIRTW